LEIDEDRGDAGAREAAQEIELWRFLQRAFKPLGDLLEHVIDTCAGPCGLHHHRLDDERGIFVAAKLHEGKEASDDGHDHQIDRERPVIECPLRKIEAHYYGSSPSKRTFWPGCRACTPAVTMTSPVVRPPETATRAGS